MNEILRLAKARKNFYYDDDEYEDVNYHFEFEGDEEVDYYEGESQEEYIKRKKIEILAQRDYNLNSPLLKGKIDEAAQNINKWFRSTSPTVRALSKQMKNIKLPNPLRWKTSDQLHAWFPKIWSLRIMTPNAKLLIKETDQLSRSAEWIPRTFVSQVFGKDISMEKSQHLSTRSCQYLEWFLLFNTCVSIMNNIGYHEADFSELAYVDKNIEIYQNRRATLLETPLGKIHITNMFVFFEKHFVVLDREFLLLLKDISNARFQSLSCLDLHLDPKMIVVSTKLDKLYLAGDQILLEMGIRAYDVIKMLEAWCNNWFSNVSMDVKPEFPKFKSFDKFLKTAISEVSKDSKSAQQFFSLLSRSETLEEVLVYYGSFRHWGHPFIDYKTGLSNLKDRVQQKRKVQKSYAEVLASDLAKKVLYKIWTTKKYWAVDVKKMKLKQPNCILLPSIEQNVWPNGAVLRNFGDKWHKLELKKCFEIPDVVDPSLIYADKSHSLNRDEFLAHFESNDVQTIPTKKVLQTFLEKEATDWPKFLDDVDKNGLLPDDKIIGLKAKERELKVEGRYFALLSWKLREYFVMTEYLIKEHFVPLFEGLTMADNYEAVMKKMMTGSANQGGSKYDSITISNHIDYSKWCNTQSHAGTNPVFTVMDKFLGYKNLISRTHNFFQESWFYYKDGGADIRIKDGLPVPVSDYPSCWIGQEGGIEGLRQKGWSILSLLSIERQVGKRNTETQVLAQGDNQVICNRFRPRVKQGKPGFEKAIQDIIFNNQSIMTQIEEGVTALGMKINQEETMQSTDYLNYGKIPIYRGVVRSLQTKRWSRVSCTTNDSLPNFGNTLGTVTSNALTVSHTLSSCLAPLRHYHWSGTLMFMLVYRFNPTLRSHCRDVIEPEVMSEFHQKYLYKDPSLGGIGGMSLTRFLIRGFPDPVTEGLSFWKRLAQGCTNADQRRFCYSFGSPRLKRYKIDDVRKLIENPTALNLPGSTGVENIIKEAVREGLRSSRILLQNEIVLDAIHYQDDNDARFISWLLSIKPLFPRFISEFYSGSYGGIMNSLIGLVQNSKTMKNIFSEGFDTKLQKKVFIGEVRSIFLLKNSASRGQEWDCSYKHAEELREQSWGGKVLGASIPHPVELLAQRFDAKIRCVGCLQSPPKNDHVVSVGYEGMKDVDECRGPFRAYLGSSTSEQTSLLQTWNKTTDIPLIKRATRLLNAINWFIDPDSNLARALIDMAEKLTGEKIGLLNESIKRTGTAVHRFSSSRQSTGGFCAQSPSRGSRQMITTDALRTFQSDNYTVMFQPLILYVQHVTGEVVSDTSDLFNQHFHISCLGCIDPVDNETRIETEHEFEFPDVSKKLEKWKPLSTSWFKEVTLPVVQEKNENQFLSLERCEIIGQNLGFFGSEMINSQSTDLVTLESLIPIVLIKKLDPRYFVDGLASGIVANACQHSVYRRHLFTKSAVSHLVYGQIVNIISSLARDSGFINLVNSNRFVRYLADKKTGINPAYPTRSNGIMDEFSIHIREMCFRVPACMKRFKQKFHILGDFFTTPNVVLLRLSLACMEVIGPSMILRPPKPDHLKQLASLLREVREDLHGARTDINLTQYSSFKVFKINSEIRFFAPKSALLEEYEVQDVDHEWLHNPQMHSNPKIRKLPSVSELEKYPNIKRFPLSLFVTSLRWYHLATGTYYKIQDLLNGLKWNNCKDSLICGDGSGGITSLMLRKSLDNRCIFNTLFTGKISDTGGMSYHGPSAVMVLPKNFRDRCVNAERSWESPSDLRKRDCWEYFSALIVEHSLNIDTVIIDMESTKAHDYAEMETHLERFIVNEKIEKVLIKCYFSLFKDKPTLYSSIIPLFGRSSVCRSVWESSNSLTFHIALEGLQYKTTRGNLNLDLGRTAEYFGWLDETNFITSERKRASRLMQYAHEMPIALDKFISKENLIGCMFEKYGSMSGLIQSVLVSQTMKEHPITVLICLYLDCLNRNLDTTTPVDASTSYPSDGAVRRAGVLFYVFNCWIQITTRNWQKLHAIEKIFAEPVPIYMNHLGNLDSKYLNWDFTAGPNCHQKLMDISGKRSDCGKWMRGLMMYTMKASSFDYSDKMVEAVGKSLKINRGLFAQRCNPFV